MVLVKDIRNEWADDAVRSTLMKMPIRLNRHEMTYLGVALLHIHIIIIVVNIRSHYNGKHCSF